MKVVLDTNIWVSAIIWGGIPEEIIVLGQKQLLSIATSQNLLSELESTLNKKKIQVKLEALNLKISSLISLVRESVTLYPIEEFNVPQLRDPDDNIVLATAIAAQSGVIITGDKDLLILGKHQNIRIVTAKDFLQRYF